jgi:hypothetical protein
MLGSNLLLLMLLPLLQALIDVAAEGGCLGSALAVMELLQGLVQVRGGGGALQYVSQCPAAALLPAVRHHALLVAYSAD